MRYSSCLESGTRIRAGIQERKRHFLPDIQGIISCPLLNGSFLYAQYLGATSNREGLPKHGAEGTLSGGTQVAEGLAKDSMVK